MLSRIRLKIAEKLGLRRVRLVNRDYAGRSFQLLAETMESVDYDDCWLAALGREAEIIFDIGCNVGHSSVLLLMYKRAKEAIVVDANPQALGLCAENLARNGLCDRARFVSAFVSDKEDAEIDFFTSDARADGSMFRAPGNEAPTVRVLTTTCDKMARDYGLIPDLVKIDVEGAESWVLAGASQLARAGGTRFFVEMHSPPGLSMIDNARRVLEWCAQHNYVAYYMKDKQVLDVPEKVADRGRCHLLLLPKGKAFPEVLRRIPQSSNVVAELIGEKPPAPRRLCTPG